MAKLTSDLKDLRKKDVKALESLLLGTLTVKLLLPLEFFGYNNQILFF